MKTAFREMRDRGKTIIFSTHQLDDAQELCHDVAIIHRGRLVISGDVHGVRKSMGNQVVRFAVAADAEVPWLDTWPRAQIVRRREDYIELAVPDEQAARELLAEALRRQEPVVRFEIDYPSLNDVFLNSVREIPAQQDGHHAATPALQMAERS
jgi:ABC-2 type transport system ATP-binding protein